MSHISDAIERKKEQLHQMDYNWRVILPSLGNDGYIDPTGQVDKNTGSDAFKILNNPALWSDVTHRVYEAELPEYSFETKANQFATGIWFSGESRSIGNISLNVDEMEDGQTLRYFDQWKSLIRNNNGTYNPPAVYKRLFMHFQTAGVGIDLTYSLYTGVFPADIQPVSWSNDGNNVRQYRITFSCDNVTHFFLPANVVKAEIEAKQNQLQLSVKGITKSTATNLGDISGNIFGAFGL